MDGREEPFCVMLRVDGPFFLTSSIELQYYNVSVVQVERSFTVLRYTPMGVQNLNTYIDRLSQSNKNVSVKSKNN